ncbi:MAG: hypothetical protein H8M99_15320, partial [Gloeobacteraceae cyanobacterium ES-bin-144]|nr:hypothetical protein [Verrucomicrobiales bacterium]
MKELIEELERWGADVIFGRAKGFRAAMMRFLVSNVPLHSFNVRLADG